jgi:hypothetical protein
MSDIEWSEAQRQIERLGGLTVISGAGGFVPLPERELADFYAEGVDLPELYKRFATTFGLCYFTRAILVEYTEYIPRTGRTDGAYVGVFYGGSRDSSPYRRGLYDMRECYFDSMPETITPIANDDYGNQFCIGVAGSEFGKVFFWDHDEQIEFDDSRQPDGSVPREVLFRNVYLVADSFLDFLKAGVPVNFDDLPE